MSRNNLNAWREILTRVFEGFTERRDVQPVWLVNPDTNRQLKLDVLYAEVGVAIRFSGLQTGNMPRRLSLEEESQQQVRDAARAQICREHGISLVQIEVVAGEPGPILQELRMALSDAARRASQGNRPHHVKARLVERLSQARSRLEDVIRRVRHIEDLRVFAELWQDRQFMAATPASRESPAVRAETDYAPGMQVRHVMFGDGYVLSVQRDVTGELITVHFEDGTQRTFAAHLVADKLSPRA
jgi:hypothetical protein